MSSLFQTQRVFRIRSHVSATVADLRIMCPYFGHLHGERLDLRMYAAGMWVGCVCGAPYNIQGGHPFGQLVRKGGRIRNPFAQHY